MLTPRESRLTSTTFDTNVPQHTRDIYNPTLPSLGIEVLLQKLPKSVLAAKIDAGRIDTP